MNLNDYYAVIGKCLIDLEEVSKKAPYNPVHLRAIITRIRDANCLYLRTPRRRPWAALFFCLAMLCVLLLIVYWILCVLWVRSTL